MPLLLFCVTERTGLDFHVSTANPSIPGSQSDALSGKVSRTDFEHVLRFGFNTNVHYVMRSFFHETWELLHL